MRLSIILVSLILLLLAACTAPSVEEVVIDDTAQKEADIQAINRINELWDEADMAGNPEALLELLTDDFIRMEPEIPAIVGKQAFLEYNRPFYEMYSFQEVKNVSEEIRLAGDWAYVRGTWKGVMVPKEGGEPITLTGKWIDIRERQEDGTWKISRASVSTDQPFEMPE